MQKSRISIIFSNLFYKLKELVKEKFISLKKNRLENTENEPDFTKKRQYVGNIIISVLTEAISVRKGLLLFPQGCEDPSIHAAWHALCHYEADEDIKARDIEYNNQQIELLEMIAFEFKDGNPLPQNIIDAYKPYYHDDPISYEKGLKGVVKKLFRFLNI